MVRAVVILLFGDVRLDQTCVFLMARAVVVVLLLRDGRVA